MSYQGIRRDRDGNTYVRYRIKGEIVEAGPYESAARALAENLGRSEPPLTSAHARTTIVAAGANPSVSVKE